MRLAMLRGAVAIVILAGCSAANAATIVIIDAQVNGAASAGGGPQNPDVLPGAVLNDIYGPKNQLTLDAGTYLITNGATSGYYSAWNFEGYPNSPNWVWSFLIADDATSKVLADGWVSGVGSTQAAMAGLVGTTTWDGNTQLSATSTRDFRDTLTLTHTTTVDFLIDDYYLPDNGGGVTLSISSVPEPSSITLLAAAAVIGIGYAASRWRNAMVRVAAWSRDGSVLS
jgi:hypothetical protein